MPALIADPGRRPAVAAVAVGVLVTVVLAAIVWHGTTTAFDTWVVRRSIEDFGSQQATGRRAWLFFSEPAISLAVPAVVVVWALCTRRIRLAVFAAVGPSLALLVTEVLGKPLVGRVIGPFVTVDGSPYQYLLAQRGSFPSGHETGTVSWLIVVLVAMFQLSRRRSVRVAAVVVAVLWALAAAVGLTINYYHYATDTVGAIASTTAVVLTVALLLDRYGDAVGRRLVRTRRAAEPVS